jgi:hypothetical protein
VGASAHEATVGFSRAQDVHSLDNCGGIVKQTLLFAVLIGLLLVGCQHPADVELQLEKNTTELEVLPVARPDTLFVVNAVDTTAVLPSEQMSFVGQFIVNEVTLDAGPGKADSFAYARVFVSDSAVRFLFRQVGYNGVDLGAVSLNGLAMVKVSHQVTVRSLLLRDTVLTRGVEYLSDLSRTYQHGAPYTWSALNTSSGALSVSILAPGRLDVLSPQGGGVFSRAKDLLLRWRGDGSRLQIIVSIFEPLTRKSIPILELRPRANTGTALLPASVLQQFPRAPFYVFTFILSNRKELGFIQAQPGKVLVQAATIYNSYIELR